MKKGYVIPKSKLFLLQLNENIATSGGIGIWTVHVLFTSVTGVSCYDYFTGTEPVPDNWNSMTSAEQKVLLDTGVVPFSCMEFIGNN